MSTVLEYTASLLLWLIFTVSVYFVLRRIQPAALSKLRFSDFILSALFLNAIFYLFGIRVADFLSLGVKVGTGIPNEQWGVILVNIFFEVILNWLILLTAPLFIVFTKRN